MRSHRHDAAYPSTPFFFGGQVRSRANVILTRREDLRGVETKEQTGLDMRVYVDREDKPMRLVFGVLLRPYSPCRSRFPPINLPSLTIQ